MSVFGKKMCAFKCTSVLVVTCRDSMAGPWTLQDQPSAPSAPMVSRLPPQPPFLRSPLVWASRSSYRRRLGLWYSLANTELLGHAR